MAKQSITVRLEAERVGVLDSWAEAHDMTRTEAVDAAIKSLTEADQDAPEGADGAGRAETHADDLRAVCEVLRGSNADLRAEVSRLWAQLTEKDAQIRSLTGIADHAQQLHAAEVTRALPSEGEGRTWRQKLAAIFGRGE